MILVELAPQKVDAELQNYIPEPDNIASSQMSILIWLLRQLFYRLFTPVVLFLKRYMISVDSL
jgi:hypothetical protein